ncbi:MAG: sodium:solute symporter [Oscillospiraceae bacterium]|nr:sodium:solute symporter [Oscillospiraceae bacterium]
MNTQTSTILILIVYIIIMLGIGFYTVKKTKSVNDFVLGGRNVGSWLTAFAYGTSYFSAVVFIGYAGQFGWNFGISSTWIGIGNAIIGSMLPWIILGKRTRLMSNHLGAKTMPEFFEKRFNSPSLKLVSAVIVFVFLIPYTASVYNGLSRLFSMAFNLGENGYAYIIIAMAILSAVYVILGGYSATAINDFIQGIVMLIGISAVVYCTVKNAGGFSTALDNLRQIEGVKNLDTVFGPDPWNLFGVVILTSLGTWGLPQMVQKFYAIKDENAIAKGTIISTLFAFVVAGGSYFMGGFIRLYCTVSGEAGKSNINVINGKPEFDAMVPALLESALPDILIGLVVMLVLSASLSTLSSLVLTSSSTLTIDLIKPRTKNMTDKKEVFILRVLIAVFLIVSVIIALNKNSSITTLMSYSWGALSGAFLGPFLYGLFSKKITSAACWTSFVLGIGITLVHMILFGFGFSAFDGLKQSIVGLNLPMNILSPINAGAFSMILSLIVVPVVSIFTQKPDEKVVDDAFSCIK